MSLQFNRIQSKRVYPTLITPFTCSGEIDYSALASLLEWYKKQNASAFFAVCESSSMFELTLVERVALARYIRKNTGGSSIVVASGHTAYSPEEQATELRQMATSGCDALVLVSNRLASPQESDEVWLSRLKDLLAELPSELPLGIYESPHPYKRIISDSNLRWICQSEKFVFMKDTSCNLNVIKNRANIAKNTKIKLYNANAATLLDSLQLGYHGYSGVMSNFHNHLYQWICDNWEREPDKSKLIQAFLSTASLIERQKYPVNAKYYLKAQGVNIESYERRLLGDIPPASSEYQEIKYLLELEKYISDQIFG